MLDLDEIIQLQYSIDNLKGLDIIRSSVTRYRAPGPGQEKTFSSWEQNLETKITCRPTEYFCAKSACA
jgi:hypothetical protein